MTIATHMGGMDAPRLGTLRAAQRRSRHLLLVGLGVALVVASFAALAIGPVAIGWHEIASALWPGGSEASQSVLIVQQIRLPRLILGLCVGAVLGMFGAALQGLFRNPLADPMIIGVSSGGVLGAALVIVMGRSFAPQLMGALGPVAIPAGAFTGSMAAIVAVYALGQRSAVSTVAPLILAGIAVNAIAAGALGYLIFVAFDEQVRELIFWQLGSLGRTSWDSLIPAALVMAGSTLLMLRLSPCLNALLLGEREAAHLGINVKTMKRQVIVLSALGVGAAVALSGLIGFVGLAAPHIVRLFAGADHRIVLPGSALLGAVLVLGADLIARTAAAPAELPIGVLTSALGGPFFIWLLNRYRRELF